MTATTDTGVGITPPATRPTVPWRRRLPYLLLLPATVTVLALVGYPVLSAVLTSFRQSDLAELVSGETVWNGLGNYTAVLSDPAFWLSTVRTLLFTAACVSTSVLGGLLVALLMRHVHRVVRGVLQVSLVLAWAMPMLAATTVFQWMFDQNYGILNKTLVQLGFPSFAGYSWFSTGWSTMAVIMVLIAWQSIPFVAFTLYAGILGVPGELYEAASLDGASSWQAFRSVTWTALRPLINIVTFLSLLWDFKVFTQVWAIRQGGPDGGSTTLPVLQFIKGIATSHFGVAAAVSVLMTLMLVAITWQNLRLMLRAEEAE
ncbi:carbohydrate ABC transporter permease [Amycolatopsis panacis]|uniref:Sugar ABC transporter permease n=1 Tax=Amycolatopsis panacis TaxID=2340917 RepID=A0A419HJG9_9PSEU|nr:sugar ABC transporter permease [Amycolatopsis panacis]RJQ75887.1 sugar ABC transporter permease [Amycolatopsis panacis]